jgi:predicted Ser/Thr protein kinase
MKPRGLRVKESHLFMTKPNPQALLSPFGWEQRFEVLEKIGAGAMGQVWRAREIGTDRIVALKMIDPARSGDEQILARLEIEGETLTKLRSAGQHEHVVPILDFKITDSHACLVMEFIPGLSLKKWCSTHQLSLTDRVRVIAQVARASGWFHGLGIIHRDLKPANILVSAVTLQPVIVDFSIAKVEDTLTLTLTNEALGTAPYMAPEQFDRRRGDISPATDVYALGATLYELLTQVVPHPGDFAQILQRLSDEVLPAPPSALNPEVPRDLASIILKALYTRPADRYSDGTEMAEDLERFLNGESVTARPISTLANVARKIRRKPALTAAIAACLMLGALILWGYRTSLAESRLRSIEDGIALLLQGSQWAAPELSAADKLLNELAQMRPARAEAMSARVTADVIRDVDDALRRAFASPDACQWVNDEVQQWLLPQNAEFAKGLPRRVADRRSVWQLVANLRLPFTRMNGFFPDGGVSSDGESLFPTGMKEAASSRKMVFTRQFQEPVEIAVIFVPTEIYFQPVSFTLERGGSSLGVMLCLAQDVTPEIRNTLSSQQPLNPDDYVLVGLINGRHDTAELIKRPSHPGISKARQSFGFQIRWEEERLDASISNMGRLEMGYPRLPPQAASGSLMRIDWPPNLVLRELTVRKRLDGDNLPFKLPDQLLSEGRWRSAEASFLRMTEDPNVRQEAAYKLAFCRWQLGSKVEAIKAWEEIAAEQGRWALASAFRLWFHTLSDQGMKASAPYLDHLPADVGAIPPAAATGVTQLERDQICERYLRSAWIMDGVRFDPARARDAQKVCRMLGLKPIEQAARLTLPLHFQGLDQSATELLQASLLNNQFPLPYPSANTALDLWCRFRWSESTPQLGTLVKTLKENAVPNQTMVLVAQQESCRALARGRQWEKALQSHLQLSRVGANDPAAAITTALLDGALRQATGDFPAAQIAWQRGIQKAARREITDPGVLMDLRTLHTATRSWNREAILITLLPLLGISLSEDGPDSKMEEFARSFINSPEAIDSLNSLADTSHGQQLILQSAFREMDARELAHHWSKLMLERYLLDAAFPTPPAAADEARVDQIMSHVLEAISAGDSGRESSLHAFLQLWTTLPAQPAVPAAPQDALGARLHNELKWLLGQRYRHLGKEDIARRLAE